MTKFFTLILTLLFIFSCKGNFTINKQYLPIHKGVSSNNFYQFYARGGERHLSLIDWGEDSLPTSAGSCHHGGEILPPQKGSIRAYLNEKNLFLDIYWDDKTKDVKNIFWDRKEKKWKDGKDDGIAIIFSKNPQFDCTTTCHMLDWKVGDSKFSSDYRMFTKDNTEYPLIILRYKKTNNKPLLAILGKDGKLTPNNEQIYHLNSIKLEKTPLTLQLYQAIKEDNQPKIPQNHDFFVLNPKNSFLNGFMEYKWGRWHAKVEIPIEKLNLLSIEKDDKIYIAIAIFDNTHANHSITKTFYATLE
ncbi:MAG: hypothetical protein N2202_06025 [Proteobacteria bacterium]|nr:hypothetical protein [Pseudomonadota bacterium]